MLWHNMCAKHMNGLMWSMMYMRRGRKQRSLAAAFWLQVCNFVPVDCLASNAVHHTNLAIRRAGMHMRHTHTLKQPWQLMSATTVKFHNMCIHVRTAHETHQLQVMTAPFDVGFALQYMTSYNSQLWFPCNIMQSRQRNNTHLSRYV